MNKINDKPVKIGNEYIQTDKDLISLMDYNHKEVKNIVNEKDINNLGLYDFILNRKNRTLDIYRYDEPMKNTKEYYGICLERISFEQLLRDYVL